MKYTLLFPPMWTPTQPYLSLPSLSAYLKEHMHEVVVCDVNIEMIEWIFQSDVVSELFEKFNDMLLVSENDDLIEILTLSKETLIANASNYLSKLRNEEIFYDSSPDKYKSAITAINYIFKLLSMIYSPQKINFGIYDYGNDVNNDKKLFESLSNLDIFPFFNFYKEFMNRISNIQQIVGISIISQEQLIPGLMLAKMIKNSKPLVSVCVGGSIITRLKDAILSNPEFFTVFDYAILFEGEESLHQLGRAIEYNLDLMAVPNLLYRFENNTIYTFTFKNLDIEKLPIPDFSGLPLDKYLSPNTVLPLLTTRGCYWNRCSFCDHSYIYNARFQMRGIERLIDDIAQLHERYGVRYFNFVDECIPPKVFKEMLIKFKTLPYEIYWSCDLRFDEFFLEEGLFEEAYNAGLRVIFFGLESGSQKILDLMNKGTEINTIRNILKSSAKAGIFNHLFGIYGFPGETIETYQETKLFIEENSQFIHSTGFSRFSLNKFSPIRYNLDSFAISDIIDLGNLRLNLEFDYESGFSDEILNEIENELNMNGIVSLGAFDQFTKVWHRDLWFLYLSRFKLTDINNNFQVNNKEILKIEDRVVLTENTFFKISNKQDTVFIFNLDTAIALEMSISSYMLLTLLKSQICIKNISDELSARCGDTSGNFEEEVLNFIQELYNRQFITKIEVE